MVRLGVAVLLASVGCKDREAALPPKPVAPAPSHIDAPAPGAGTMMIRDAARGDQPAWKLVANAQK